MGTPPRTAGRFRSSLDDVALIRVVGRIAHAVAPDAPATVSQTAYDRARQAAGHDGAPTAAATARRLGMPWRALLQVACDPERDPQRTLAALRRSEADEVSLEEAVAALRIVSVRLGGVPLNPARYEAERQAMIAADQRRRRGGGPAGGPVGELPLPTAGRMERLGPFGELLEIAGLEHGADDQSQLAVPAEEALEAFLTEQGFLISFEQLRRWGNARGMRVKKLAPRRYQDVIATLQADRAARGLWTPERPTPKNERPPDLEPHDGQARVAPRQRSWNYPECVDALARAIAELPPGVAILDQRAYRAIARGRDDMPSATQVGKVAAANGTTFSAMREEAARR